MNYGADAVNELLWVSLDVTTTPQNLPGMVPVNQGQVGYQALRPDNSKPFNPGHALITVETGICRVRCDGTEWMAGKKEIRYKSVAGETRFTMTVADLGNVEWRNRNVRRARGVIEGAGRPDH